MKTLNGKKARAIPPAHEPLEEARSAIQQALREGCWFVYASVGTQKIRIADARIHRGKLLCKSWKSEKWYAINEWDWEKNGVWGEA